MRVRRRPVAPSLPDGRTLLASAGADRTVRLWDPVTRQQTGLLHLPGPVGVGALAGLPGSALAVVHGTQVAVVDGPPPEQERPTQGRSVPAPAAR